jgi:hypothetical protein
MSFVSNGVATANIEKKFDFNSIPHQLPTISLPGLPWHALVLYIHEEVLRKLQNLISALMAELLANC